MYKILVPIDFSKCAANALHFALELGHRYGAEISVLHAIYPNEGIDNNVYQAFWVDEYVEQRRKGARDWAIRVRSRYPLLRDVPLSSECEIGFPVSSIQATAKRIGADLIVMGTTGATGLAGSLLGSVANGVIATAKIPVFVIPPKAKLQVGMPVAYATDFKERVSAQDIAAVKKAVQEGYGSSIKAIHVLSKPGEKPDKAHETALAEKFEGIPADFHYLHDKNIVQAVRNFIDSTDAGALVAVAHEHSVIYQLFFGSVTRELARYLKVPILVLHG